MTVILCAVSFVIYAVTAGYDKVSMDVWSANFATWHLVSTGQVGIEGLGIPPLEIPLRHVWVLQDAAGNDVIGRSPGVIEATLPAYLLFQSDAMTLVPGALTAALMTAISLGLIYRALRTRLSRPRSLVSVSILGFATPVWTIAADGMWPHTVTLLGIAGMALAASRDRWWLVGMFGGVVLWGRLHAAVIVMVLGLLMAWRRRSPVMVLKVGLPGAAALALTCAWHRWMYGTWSPTASYDASAFIGYAESNQLSITNQLGFWISPDRGILVWTPLVVMILPALWRSWRTLPDWSTALALGGLTYTVVQGVLNRFSGGEGFYGYRLGIEFIACATPALAFSSPNLGRVGRLWLGPVVGLMAGAMLAGAVQDQIFVSADRVWVDNAFALAVRTNPAQGVLIIVACVAMGFFVQRRIEARSDRQAS